MASAISIEVLGGRQAVLALRTLTRKAEGEIVKRGVRAGAKIIAQEVRKNIKTLVGVEQGDLRKSTTRRSKTYPGVFNITVGPGHARASHAHLIEEGTVDRFTKSGAFRGKMTPVPFAEKAFDAKAADAKRVMETTIVRGVEREASRLGRSS